MLVAFGAASASATTPVGHLSAQATALATYAATDEGGGIDITSKNPTPTPTLAPTTTPGNSFNLNGTQVPLPSFGGKFAPPPTLDELLKEFPDLKQYIDPNLKIDQIDLGQLYKKLLDIYKTQGASGVAAFLKDSGLLEKMGLPVAYLDLLLVLDKEGLEGVFKLAKDRGYINSKNEIVAFVTPKNLSDSAQICADMAKLGVTCTTNINLYGQLEIGIPIEVLSSYQTPGTLIKYLISVAQVNNVIQVSAPLPKATSDKMSPETVRYMIGQGPKFIGADAWQKAGITGKGVTVGVLDLEFGGVKQLANGKDLPADVEGAQPMDELDAMEGNHGTACAQVVHGVAPDAKILVGLADSNDHYNESINFFIKNGVQIITYSVGSTIGPRDGTFGEALAVDEIVKQTGVLWLTAAGNEAVNHSLFEYKDGDSDGLEDFDGKNALPFIAFDPNTSVSMNWNGNWNGKEANEYTFTIYDADGNEVASAAEPRKGRKNDFPFQQITFQAVPQNKYFITISRSAKTKGKGVIDLFINNALFPDYAQVQGRSVTTPGDSDSSLTVGATGLTKDVIEFYSSQGPTMDGRLKPDLSAPTGEKVTGHPDGFNGTSGATPLVAGTAALWFQAFPGITAAEVRAALIKNVVDLGKKGPDAVFGAGRIKLPGVDTINADQGPNTDTTPEPGTDDSATPEPVAAPTKAPTKPPKGTAAAEITDSSIKFNVSNKGIKGIQVNTSFTVNGMKGKPAAVIIVFFQSDGQTPVKSKTKDFTIFGTLGTFATFKPKFDSSEFSDVPLFLPNSEFGGLPKGDNDLVYVIGVLDLSDQNNAVLLAKSDPQQVTVTRK
jgi:hypothetical protein